LRLPVRDLHQQGLGGSAAALALVALVGRVGDRRQDRDDHHHDQQLHQRHAALPGHPSTSWRQYGARRRRDRHAAQWRC
jgi:hypothetical protein